MRAFSNSAGVRGHRGPPVSPAQSTTPSAPGPTTAANTLFGLKDTSLFGGWLRLARSSKFYLIPLSLLVWGFGVLLLSYLAGNFWLERKASSALFGLLITNGQITQGDIFDGTAEDNTVINGLVQVDKSDKNKIHIVDARDQSPAPGSARTAQASPPGDAADTDTSKAFHVGYILHFNWSFWNALIIPTLGLIAVMLYKSTEGISDSLVANGVVSLESGTPQQAREELRLYLEQVSLPLEAWFIFGAAALITIHAWNDGRDFLTNLGFDQPHKYPTAYFNPRITPSMMTIFLLVAYAGTYVSLAVLVHFLVWAIAMYRRLEKLVPEVRNGTDPQLVAIKTNGVDTTFRIVLRPGDDRHFGIGALSRLFDGIHWFASLCILESPIQRVGELLRDPHTRVEAQGWETPTITIICATILFLMPLLLTSDRVWRYKLALEASGHKIRGQKIWPAGSIPVRFLAFAVAIALTLPVIEAFKPNHPDVILTEYWNWGLRVFSVWSGINVINLLFETARRHGT